jgi:hypothetical protein
MVERDLIFFHTRCGVSFPGKTNIPRGTVANLVSNSGRAGTILERVYLFFA